MKPAKEWANDFPQGVCGEAMSLAAKRIREIQRDAMRTMRDAAVKKCNCLLGEMHASFDARTIYVMRLLGDHINSIDIDKLMEQP